MVQSIGRIFHAFAVARTDLVRLIGEHARLWQEGEIYFGDCPFCRDGEGQLWIDPAARKWGCHRCSDPSDAVDYVSVTEGVEPSRAVRILIERLGSAIRMN